MCLGDYSYKLFHKFSVINPIMVDSFAALFNCTPVERASDYDGTDLKLFNLVG